MRCNLFPHTCWFLYAKWGSSIITGSRVFGSAPGGSPCWYRPHLSTAASILSYPIHVPSLFEETPAFMDISARDPSLSPPHGDSWASIRVIPFQTLAMQGYSIYIVGWIWYACATEEVWREGKESHTILEMFHGQFITKGHLVSVNVQAAPFEKPERKLRKVLFGGAAPAARAMTLERADI